MVAIFADDTFILIFLYEICCLFNYFFAILNKPALVQLMAWHRTGDKPSSEPMVAEFTNAYVNALLGVDEHTKRNY